MPFNAGSIKGGLSWDVSEYAQGMLQATTTAAIFPGIVTAFLANPLLGAAQVAKQVAGSIVDGLKWIITTTMEVGHAMDDLGEAAQTAGVSAQFLKGVGLAASDAGGSMQEMGDALKFLNKNLAEAAAGGAAKDAFAALGISATDASGRARSTEDVFMELSDAIARIQDPSKRTAVAMDLMGRGGTGMIVTMAQGSQKINEFRTMMANLGAVPTQGLVDAGDKFSTLGTIVGAAMEGMKNSLAGPILQWFADNFNEIVERIMSLAAEMRPVFESIGNLVVELLPSLMQIGEWFVRTLIPIIKATLEWIKPLIEGLSWVLGAVGNMGIGPSVATIGAGSSSHTTNNHINVNVAGGIRSAGDAEDLAKRIASQQRTAAVKGGL